MVGNQLSLVPLCKTYIADELQPKGAISNDLQNFASLSESKCSQSESDRLWTQVASH